MKKIISWFFGLVLVLLILLAFFTLWRKSQAKTTIYETESAEVTDIVKKTVATGSIVPRKEVEVKPKVTGVLAKLTAQPGDVVKEGAPLGTIKIVPDAMQINQAEAGVRSAQIAFDGAKRELDRNEELAKKGVVADAELQKFRTEFAMRKQELASSGSSLQLVKEGATRGQGKESTLIVTATVGGTIIDVPVKEGNSVIQANNFNPGTTVAVIADMSDIIFEGRVDESEVGKIKEGLNLQIKVGAIENEKLEGTLEYIAPKGKLIDGAIQFEIKAKVRPGKDSKIRANYSANADIVLAEKKQVLAIREALVQYDKEQPFVEIETTPQTFVRKDIKLGLSDGIKVEVLDNGVSKSDKIKIPDNAGPANPMMGSGGPGGGKKPGGPPKK
ncbi:MAG: efflux RND transporter periplasmic adaptor subunit [Deltaproteobacteria bacterium]|nr:efflux RND transporter periplasmic adaptor subunit [Deltaproteobacteria bacterium]